MRPGEERLGLERGNRDPRKVAGGRIDDETGHPGRLELGVEPIQPLDLEPPRRKQKHTAPTPQERSGSQTLSTFQGGPEYREVEGDAIDAQLWTELQRVDDEQLVDAGVRSPVASHEVQGHPVSTPGHELQERSHDAILTCHRE